MLYRHGMGAFAGLQYPIESYYRMERALDAVRRNRQNMAREWRTWRTLQLDPLAAFTPLLVLSCENVTNVPGHIPRSFGV